MRRRSIFGWVLWKVTIVIFLFLNPMEVLAQLEYVKELYMEGMQPDKIYYLRMIRRNLQRKDQPPVWQICIGEEKSLKDDKADGSSVVLSYYSNKNASCPVWEGMSRWVSFGKEENSFMEITNK